jgi:RNA polymerase sigma-70 factor (ECF subfamily)
MDDQIRARLDQELYTEAFELLLTTYDRKVFHLAYALLGSRSLAEDAAQDIFVRIWRALPSYRGEASLSTWVYAITRNTCLTTRKRSVTQSTSSLDDPAVLGLVESRGDGAPRVPHTPDLAALVSQLPEKYKQALLLFYMEEKSYEEVAHQMALPVGTVRTYLHRGKKALAAAFLETTREGGPS